MPVKSFFFLVLVCGHTETPLIIRVLRPLRHSNAKRLSFPETPGLRWVSLNIMKDYILNRNIFFRFCGRYYDLQKNARPLPSFNYFIWETLSNQCLECFGCNCREQKMRPLQQDCGDNQNIDCLRQKLPPAMPDFRAVVPAKLVPVKTGSGIPGEISGFLLPHIGVKLRQFCLFE